MRPQTAKIEMTELHWLMDMLQSIDVGLVVLDREYSVQVWNSFMANHSGIPARDIIGKNLFNVFAEVPEDWFKRKAESVLLLNCRSFTTWEQRPFLFKFKNYRPITGPAEFMYQNVTLIPLTSADGTVNHIGVIIYDVTDGAINGSELEKANSTLQELSRTDHLTRLHNRGYWEERMQEEFLRAKRTDQPCSLILFDIDFFKDINDEYGHQAGDEVIRLTAEQVRKKVRATDIAGRYGGEEFGIVLIDTDADSARYLAERLRKSIAAMTVDYDGCKINFTISLGVAEITEEIDQYHHWLECADQALYRAKESGRDCVILYREDE
jgi:diguanylate cyclase (GGDEF)-like protein